MLQRGDVLKFVDDEAAVAVPELLGHPDVVLDGRGGVQQQVIEVEHRDVTAGLEVLVAGVDGRDPRGVERNIATDLGHRGRILLGGDQRGLRPLDLTGEVADVVGAGLHPRPVGGLGHHRELAVEQLPPGVADHAGPEVGQLAPGGGVERQRLHRPDPRGVRFGGVDAAQPGAHLAGGPRREGDRQHLTGRHLTSGDEVRDAVSDGAGLPRSRTRQHTHRAAGRQHRLALFVVKTVGGHGVHLGRRW